MKYLLTILQVSEAQKNVGSNHAVSGLKFKILRHFLQLGYSVLLSDVDIITLQNPFRHLHRDSDVEAMSDGWDNATAYGGCCHLLYTHLSSCLLTSLYNACHDEASQNARTSPGMYSGMLSIVLL